MLDVAVNEIPSSKFDKKKDIYIMDFALNRFANVFLFCSQP